jgi:proteasome lid subunit RPN8/RPN11
MNAPSIDIDAAKNIIRDHAAHCDPYECCGLIVRQGQKQIVLTGNNITIEDPRHNFTLHPQDYIDAEEQGEIIAIYHSHVNEPPEPSDGDRTLAEMHGLPVIIVSWPSDTWVVCEPSGFKADLVGRPFVYGVLDCLTLMRDYYKEKHDIDIPEFNYTAKWWERGENLYLDNLPTHGFVRVSAIKPDDLILMQIDAPVPNHCAIYIGDGMMLHHPPAHLSGYHPYVCERGYYALCTVGFWRHKKLMGAI